MRYCTTTAGAWERRSRGSPVLEAEYVAWCAVERVTDGGQCVEPQRPGAPVLQDRQICHGDADSRGELDQRHPSRREKLVQVHRDPMLWPFCHQMTVSSSSRMATPRAISCAKAAKMSPTASHPSGEPCGATAAPDSSMVADSAHIAALLTAQTPRPPSAVIFARSISSPAVCAVN